jgi:hypothetical protein
MNEAQPNFLSTLVVSFPLGDVRFAEKFTQGTLKPFRQLTQQELFSEMEMLLSELDLQRTIFRSDHASNYLVLKGVLGDDKEALLGQVRQALHQPSDANLRQEWQRGL